MARDAGFIGEGWSLTKKVEVIFLAECISCGAVTHVRVESTDVATGSKSTHYEAWPYHAPSCEIPGVQKDAGLGRK